MEYLHHRAKASASREVNFSPLVLLNTEHKSGWLSALNSLVIPFSCSYPASSVATRHRVTHFFRAHHTLNCA
jgi:hypothetical protein